MDYMHSLIKMVRQCQNCTEVVGGLSDEEIIAFLNDDPENDMSLLDVLVTVGCEVVVEEIDSRIKRGG